MLRHLEVIFFWGRASSAKAKLGAEGIANNLILKAPKQNPLSKMSGSLITYFYTKPTLKFIPHTMNVVLRRINLHSAANSRHRSTNLKDSATTASSNSSPDNGGLTLLAGGRRLSISRSSINR